MDLKDFIAKTLQEVTEGIAAGSSSTVKFQLGGGRQPGIHFDVAVTTKTAGQSKKEGGVRIRVLEFGAGKLKKEEQQRVHRIQFTVTVDRGGRLIIPLNATPRPSKR